MDRIETQRPLDQVFVEPYPTALRSFGPAPVIESGLMTQYSDSPFCSRSRSLDGIPLSQVAEEGGSIRSARGDWLMTFLASNQAIPNFDTELFHVYCCFMVGAPQALSESEAGPGTGGQGLPVGGDLAEPGHEEGGNARSFTKMDTAARHVAWAQVEDHQQR